MYIGFLWIGILTNNKLFWLVAIYENSNQKEDLETGALWYYTFIIQFI